MTARNCMALMRTSTAACCSRRMRERLECVSRSSTMCVAEGANLKLLNMVANCR